MAPAAQTRTGLLARHATIAGELAGLHRQLGLSLAAERHDKVTAFAQASGESDKRRENIGAYNALANTKTSLDLQQQIYALQEERDNIRLHLAHGGFTEG